MPPLSDKNRKRFSEISSSSSKCPNFRLNQGLPLRLSNRTKAFSKCQTAVGSEDGSNENVMFLNSVPTNQKSMPDRSNPCCVTVLLMVELPVPPPGMESIGWFVVCSRCQFGVMRAVIGKYAGFCQ